MARSATLVPRALSGLGTVRSRAAVLWTLCALLVAGCSNVTGVRPTAQAPQPTPAAPPPVTRVALLLPLSGQSAAIGQPMLESAQMALFDVAGDRFELLPRDTRGTPQGAADAARAALADGARLVLGPLFAPEVAAVKPITQAAGVPVLAFSTDWTLAGGGTHILGFVPSDQVNRVVGFARSRGVTRFATLAPRSPYGDAVVNALQAATLRLGGQLTQIERYEPGNPDTTQVVQPLIGLPTPPQAVMLADGVARARQIGAALAAGGVDTAQVRLLGTGLWDEPGLGQEPAMVGAWFAAPAPRGRADFEARFESIYGRKPPRLATLSYDATAMAAALTKAHGQNAFTPANLTSRSGFDGVDGLFRLTAGGVAERGLAVLEVTPDGTRVIDPAPPSFATLGQ